ncbi:dual specificity protein phosphatase 22-like [Gigantopelta aegis]|uniref:dual specificity protein phosphatase 22-like n=1 Tax=Gigantopelta aegis TaxID=1735272 RepID=UPI001B88C1F4|nr:dual specificity protein phosphatase 22-like [Gigantopelta aegis]XP_041376321.1 dual specificity protein phosphatase 22-like [Gigantopelta aegis]
MGNAMNKIIDGVYVGNFRDAKDEDELKKHKITHILSIHDNAKQLLKDMQYLCIVASDSPDQDLTQYFPECIDFIHRARLDGGRVLIHCLAGVSRSVTITAAYLMTVTNFRWRDTLHAIRGARNCANPNFGFQRQLMSYQCEKLEEERKRLKEQFPPIHNDDESEMRQLLEAYNKFVLHGSPPSDDYPLPLDAYSNRKKSNRDANNGDVTNSQQVNDHNDDGNDDGKVNDANHGDCDDVNRETDR